VTTSEKRLGMNEALFRETNERIEARVQETVGEEDSLEIICECGSLDCNERIRLSREEYAVVRSDPAQFAVKPGHAIADVEEVVARNERYEIVRKQGVAAEVAEFLDGDQT
jgi:5-bromo-4-chloroindolyl phosphate hydrolysis protein